MWLNLLRICILYINHCRKKRSVFRTPEPTESTLWGTIWPDYGSEKDPWVWWWDHQEDGDLWYDWHSNGHNDYYDYHDEGHLPEFLKHMFGIHKHKNKRVEQKCNDLGDFLMDNQHNTVEHLVIENIDGMLRYLVELAPLLCHIREESTDTIVTPPAREESTDTIVTPPEFQTISVVPFEKPPPLPSFSWGRRKRGLWDRFTGDDDNGEDTTPSGDIVTEYTTDEDTNHEETSNGGRWDWFNRDRWGNSGDTDTEDTTAEDTGHEDTTDGGRFNWFDGDNWGNRDRPTSAPTESINWDLDDTFWSHGTLGPFQGHQIAKLLTILSQATEFSEMCHNLAETAQNPEGMQEKVEEMRNRLLSVVHDYDFCTDVLGVLIGDQGDKRFHLCSDIVYAFDSSHSPEVSGSMWDVISIAGYVFDKTVMDALLDTCDVYDHHGILSADERELCHASRDPKSEYFERNCRNVFGRGHRGKEEHTWLEWLEPALDHPMLHQLAMSDMFGDEWEAEGVCKFAASAIYEDSITTDQLVDRVLDEVLRELARISPWLCYGSYYEDEEREGTKPPFDWEDEEGEGTKTPFEWEDKERESTKPPVDRVDKEREGTKPPFNWEEMVTELPYTNQWVTELWPPKDGSPSMDPIAALGAVVSYLGHYDSTESMCEDITQVIAAGEENNADLDDRINMIKGNLLWATKDLDMCIDILDMIDGEMDSRYMYDFLGISSNRLICETLVHYFNMDYGLDGTKPPFWEEGTKSPSWERETETPSREERTKQPATKAPFWEEGTKSPSWEGETESPSWEEKPKPPFYDDIVPFDAAVKFAAHLYHTGRLQNALEASCYMFSKGSNAAMCGMISRLPPEIFVTGCIQYITPILEKFKGPAWLPDWVDKSDLYYMPSWYRHLSEDFSIVNLPELLNDLYNWGFDPGYNTVQMCTSFEDAVHRKYNHDEYNFAVMFKKAISDSFRFLTILSPSACEDRIVRKPREFSTEKTPGEEFYTEIPGLLPTDETPDEDVDIDTFTILDEAFEYLSGYHLCDQEIVEAAESDKQWDTDALDPYIDYATDNFIKVLHDTSYCAGLLSEISDEIGIIFGFEGNNDLCELIFESFNHPNHNGALDIDIDIFRRDAETFHGDREWYFGTESPITELPPEIEDDTELQFILSFVTETVKLTGLLYNTENLHGMIDTSCFVFGQTGNVEEFLGYRSEEMCYIIDESYSSMSRYNHDLEILCEEVHSHDDYPDGGDGGDHGHGDKDKWNWLHWLEWLNQHDWRDDWGDDSHKPQQSEFPEWYPQWFYANGAENIPKWLHHFKKDFSLAHLPGMVNDLFELGYDPDHEAGEMCATFNDMVNSYHENNFKDVFRGAITDMVRFLYETSLTVCPIIENDTEAAMQMNIDSFLLVAQATEFFYFEGLCDLNWEPEDLHWLYEEATWLIDWVFEDSDWCTEFLSHIDTDTDIGIMYGFQDNYDMCQFITDATSLSFDNEYIDAEALRLDFLTETNESEKQLLMESFVKELIKFVGEVYGRDEGMYYAILDTCSLFSQDVESFLGPRSEEMCDIIYAGTSHTQDLVEFCEDIYNNGHEDGNDGGGNWPQWPDWWNRPGNGSDDDESDDEDDDNNGDDDSKTPWLDFGDRDKLSMDHIFVLIDNLFGIDLSTPKGVCDATASLYYDTTITAEEWVDQTLEEALRRLAYMSPMLCYGPEEVPTDEPEEEPEKDTPSFPSLQTIKPVTFARPPTIQSFTIKTITLREVEFNPFPFGRRRKRGLWNEDAITEAPFTEEWVTERWDDDLATSDIDSAAQALGAIIAYLGHYDDIESLCEDITGIVAAGVEEPENDTPSGPILQTIRPVTFAKPPSIPYWRRRKRGLWNEDATTEAPFTKQWVTERWDDEIGIGDLDERVNRIKNNFLLALRDVDMCTDILNVVEGEVDLQILYDLVGVSSNRLMCETLVEEFNQESVSEIDLSFLMDGAIQANVQPMKEIIKLAGHLYHAGTFKDVVETSCDIFNHDNTFGMCSLISILPRPLFVASCVQVVTPLYEDMPNFDWLPNWLPKPGGGDDSDDEQEKDFPDWFPEYFYAAGDGYIPRWFRYLDEEFSISYLPAIINYLYDWGYDPYEQSDIDHMCPEFNYQVYTYDPYYGFIEILRKAIIDTFDFFYSISHAVCPAIDDDFNLGIATSAAPNQVDMNSFILMRRALDYLVGSDLCDQSDPYYYSSDAEDQFMQIFFDSLHCKGFLNHIGDDVKTKFGFESNDDMCSFLYSAMNNPDSTDIDFDVFQRDRDFSNMDENVSVFLVTELIKLTGKLYNWGDLSHAVTNTCDIFSASGDIDGHLGDRSEEMCNLFYVGYTSYDEIATFCQDIFNFDEEDTGPQWPFGGRPSGDNDWNLMSLLSWLTDKHSDTVDILGFVEEKFGIQVLPMLQEWLGWDNFPIHNLLVSLKDMSEQVKDISEQIMQIREWMRDIKYQLEEISVHDMLMALQDMIGLDISSPEIVCNAAATVLYQTNATAKQWLNLIVDESLLELARLSPWLCYGRHEEDWEGTKPPWDLVTELPFTEWVTDKWPSDDPVLEIVDPIHVLGAVITYLGQYESIDSMCEDITHVIEAGETNNNDLDERLDTIKLHFLLATSDVDVCTDVMNVVRDELNMGIPTLMEMPSSRYLCEAITGSFTPVPNTMLPGYLSSAKHLMSMIPRDSFVAGCTQAMHMIQNTFDDSDNTDYPNWYPEWFFKSGVENIPTWYRHIGGDFSLVNVPQVLNDLLDFGYEPYTDAFAMCDYFSSMVLYYSWPSSHDIVREAIHDTLRFLYRSSFAVCPTMSDTMYYDITEEPLNVDTFVLASDIIGYFYDGEYWGICYLAYGSSEDYFIESIASHVTDVLYDADYCSGLIYHIYGTDMGSKYGFADNYDMCEFIRESVSVPHTIESINIDALRYPDFTGSSTGQSATFFKELIKVLTRLYYDQSGLSATLLDTCDIFSQTGNTEAFLGDHSQQMCDILHADTQYDDLLDFCVQVNSNDEESWNMDLLISWLIGGNGMQGHNLIHDILGYVGDIAGLNTTLAEDWLNNGFDILMFLQDNMEQILQMEQMWNDMGHEMGMFLTEDTLHLLQELLGSEGVCNATSFIIYSTNATPGEQTDVLLDATLRELAYMSPWLCYGDTYGYDHGMEDGTRPPFDEWQPVTKHPEWEQWTERPFTEWYDDHDSPMVDPIEILGMIFTQLGQYESTDALCEDITQIVSSGEPNNEELDQFISRIKMNIFMAASSVDMCSSMLNSTEGDVSMQMLYQLTGMSSNRQMCEQLASSLSQDFTSGFAEHLQSGKRLLSQLPPQLFHAGCTRSFNIDDIPIQSILIMLNENTGFGMHGASAEAVCGAVTSGLSDAITTADQIHNQIQYGMMSLSSLLCYDHALNESDGGFMPLFDNMDLSALRTLRHVIAHLGNFGNSALMCQNLQTMSGEGGKNATEIMNQMQTNLQQITLSADSCMEFLNVIESEMNMTLYSMLGMTSNYELCEVVISIYVSGNSSELGVSLLTNALTMQGEKLIEMVGDMIEQVVDGVLDEAFDRLALLSPMLCNESAWENLDFLNMEMLPIFGDLRPAELVRMKGLLSELLNMKETSNTRNVFKLMRVVRMLMDQVETGDWYKDWDMVTEFPFAPQWPSDRDPAMWDFLRQYLMSALQMLSEFELDFDQEMVTDNPFGEWVTRRWNEEPDLSMWNSLRPHLQQVLRLVMDQMDTKEWNHDGDMVTNNPFGEWVTKRNHDGGMVTDNPFDEWVTEKWNVDDFSMWDMLRPHLKQLLGMVIDQLGTEEWNHNGDMVTDSPFEEWITEKWGDEIDPWNYLLTELTNALLTLFDALDENNWDNEWELVTELPFTEKFPEMWPDNTDMWSFIRPQLMNGLLALMDKFEERDWNNEWEPVTNFPFDDFITERWPEEDGPLKMLRSLVDLIGKYENSSLLCEDINNMTRSDIDHKYIDMLVNETKLIFVTMVSDITDDVIDYGLELAFMAHSVAMELKEIATEVVTESVEVVSYVFPLVERFYGAEDLQSIAYIACEMLEFGSCEMITAFTPELIEDICVDTLSPILDTHDKGMNFTSFKPHDIIMFILNATEVNYTSPYSLCNTSASLVFNESVTAATLVDHVINDTLHALVNTYVSLCYLPMATEGNPMEIVGPALAYLAQYENTDEMCRNMSTLVMSSLLGESESLNALVEEMKMNLLHAVIDIDECKELIQAVESESIQMSVSQLAGFESNDDMCQALVQGFNADSTEEIDLSFVVSGLRYGDDDAFMGGDASTTFGDDDTVFGDKESVVFGDDDTTTTDDDTAMEWDVEAVMEGLMAADSNVNPVEEIFKFVGRLYHAGDLKNVMITACETINDGTDGMFATEMVPMCSAISDLSRQNFVHYCLVSVAPLYNVTIDESFIPDYIDSGEETTTESGEEDESCLFCSDRNPYDTVFNEVLHLMNVRFGLNNIYNGYDICYASIEFMTADHDEILNFFGEAAESLVYGVLQQVYVPLICTNQEQDHAVTVLNLTASMIQDVEQDIQPGTVCQLLNDTLESDNEEVLRSVSTAIASSGFYMLQSTDTCVELVDAVFQTLSDEEFTQYTGFATYQSFCEHIVTSFSGESNYELPVLEYDSNFTLFENPGELLPSISVETIISLVGSMYVSNQSAIETLGLICTHYEGVLSEIPDGMEIGESLASMCVAIQQQDLYHISATCRQLLVPLLEHGDEHPVSLRDIDVAREFLKILLPLVDQPVWEEGDVVCPATEALINSAFSMGALVENILQHWLTIGVEMTADICAEWDKVYEYNKPSDYYDSPIVAFEYNSRLNNTWKAVATFFGYSSAEELCIATNTALASRNEGGMEEAKIDLTERIYSMATDATACSEGLTSVVALLAAQGVDFDGNNPVYLYTGYLSAQAFCIDFIDAMNGVDPGEGKDILFLYHKIFSVYSFLFNA